MECQSPRLCVSWRRYRRRSRVHGGRLSGDPPEASGLRLYWLTCLLIGGSYETPQTEITIAIPSPPEGFEITPVVERAVELYFTHLYPTYPILSREVRFVWFRHRATVENERNDLRLVKGAAASYGSYT